MSTPQNLSFMSARPSICCPDGRQVHNVNLPVITHVHVWVVARVATNLSILTSHKGQFNDVDDSVLRYVRMSVNVDCDCESMNVWPTGCSYKDRVRSSRSGLLGIGAWSTDCGCDRKG